LRAASQRRVAGPDSFVYAFKGEMTERGSWKGTDGVPAVIQDKQSKPRKKYHRVALVVDHSTLQIK
jgi:hypothetical protein